MKQDMIQIEPVNGSQKVLFKFLEYLTIFLIGGNCYGMIEVLWRGHTHWTMVIVGGLSLMIIGVLNEGCFPSSFGLIPQMITGGIIITMLEFICGCIVNLWLGWNIWDYSNAPFNILGQICLPFTFAWILLSAVAIFVDDYIRLMLFGEERPKYHLWKS